MPGWSKGSNHFGSGPGMSLELVDSESDERRIALLSYSGTGPDQAADLERALDALWPSEQDRLIFCLNLFGAFPPRRADGSEIAVVVEAGVLASSSNRRIAECMLSVRCEHVMICEPGERELAWSAIDKYVELGTRRFAQYVARRERPPTGALAFFESTSVGLDCVLASSSVHRVAAGWIQMLVNRAGSVSPP